MYTLTQYHSSDLNHLGIGYVNNTKPEQNVQLVWTLLYSSHLNYADTRAKCLKLNNCVKNFDKR